MDGAKRDGQYTAQVAWNEYIMKYNFFLKHKEMETIKWGSGYPSDILNCITGT